MRAVRTQRRWQHHFLGLKNESMGAGESGEGPSWSNVGTDGCPGGSKGVEVSRERGGRRSRETYPRGTPSTQGGEAGQTLAPAHQMALHDQKTGAGSADAEPLWLEKTKGCHGLCYIHRQLGVLLTL